MGFTSRGTSYSKLEWTQQSQHSALVCFVLVTMLNSAQLCVTDLVITPHSLPHPLWDEYTLHHLVSKLEVQTCPCSLLLKLKSLSWSPSFIEPSEKPVRFQGGGNGLLSQQLSPAVV